MSRIITLVLLIIPCALFSQHVIELDDIDKKSRKKFEQALNCLKKNDHDKGLKQLEDLTHKYPGFLIAHKHLARNYLRINQKKKAWYHLKTIDKISSEFDIPFKMSLADLYEENGMLDSALFHISQLKGHSGLNPEHKDQIEFRYNELKFRRDAYSTPLDIVIEKLGSEINTKDDEYHPGMNAESSALVFVRRAALGSAKKADENLYTSFVSADSFSLSELVKNVNTSFNEGAQSISEDGSILIFTSCNRRDGYGGCDLYISFKKINEWTKPVNMGPQINTHAWESQPTICNNNKTIYFSSTRSGGYGGSDIWRIELNENNQWNEAVNLGPKINTAKDETGPFMHPDKHTLYFRSNGHIGLGDFDIFLSRQTGQNEWSNVVNLGYPINSTQSESALFVDLKGDYAYFSSNKNSDNQDIYRFTLPDQFKPDIVSYMKIIVTDVSTKEPLKSTIKITNLDNRHKEERNTDIEGKLIHTFKKGNYQLTISHPEYLFHSENIFLSGEGSQWKPFVYMVALHKIPGDSEIASKPKAIVLNNIFFASGSSELLTQSELEIQTLFEFLEKNNDLSIKILGHTDNIGSEENNLQLSQERAKAVYNALVAKGISQTRLSYLGHGEKMPLVTNETEKGRQINRRTEFIIVD